MGKKLTFDEMKERLRNSPNSMLEFCEEPKNIGSPTLVRCTLCGQTWSPRPYDLFNGKIKHTCGKNIIWDNSSLKRMIHDVSNGSLTLLDDKVQNVSHRALVHCNVCGHEWNPPLIRIQSGHGCPKCTGHLPYTRESYIRDLDRMSENTLELVGDFIDTNHDVTVRCKVCGTVRTVGAHGLIHKPTKCKVCSGKEKWDRERIAKAVYEVTNGQLELIGDTNGNSKKAKFRCNKCGNELDIIPVTIISGGTRCRFCNNNVKKSQEEVAEMVYNKSHGRLTLIGEANGTHSVAEVRCNVCGYVYPTYLRGIIHRNRGCPKCNSSRGEELIADWLDEFWEEDDFVLQKRFDGLTGVGGGLLSYDFYIESKNLCIEYQGEQHYKPTYFSSNVDAEEQFKVQQEHDQRKRQYCIDHGIDLLEIPYTDKDRIEEILNERLLGIHETLLNE